MQENNKELMMENLIQEEVDSYFSVNKNVIMKNNNNDPIINNMESKKKKLHNKHHHTYQWR